MFWNFILVLVDRYDQTIDTIKIWADLRDFCESCGENTNKKGMSADSQWTNKK